MKKLFLSLIVITILIFISSLVLKGNNTSIENSTQNNQSDLVATGEMIKDIPGEVSYTVQKVFLNKPTDTVVGTTSDVLGLLKYEENILEADVTISTENLTTGTDKRDARVKDLLGKTIQASIPRIEINLSEVNSVLVDLTINNVTKEIPFEISAIEQADSLVLTGNAYIMMTEFAIDPPGTEGIYTVEDKTLVSFELSV